MTAPPPFRRLPLSFDATALLPEALALPPEAWASHFNTGYHNGGWTGAALRGSSVDHKRLFVDFHSSEPASDTPLARRCPRLIAALDAFQCRLRAVRLLRLAPGGIIELHHDPDLQFDQGEARLHIPLATHSAVEFYVDGEQVIMLHGECWYLDLSRPHRVSNRGSTDRIHLVIDAIVNPWLEQMIAGGDEPRRVAVANGRIEFERFREQVLSSPPLASRLRAVADVEAFVALSVTLGSEAGCRFDGSDVRAAMHEGQQRWLAQWIL